MARAIFACPEDGQGGGCSLLRRAIGSGCDRVLVPRGIRGKRTALAL